jgi:hypothetical protein
MVSLSKWTPKPCCSKITFANVLVIDQPIVNKIIIRAKLMNAEPIESLCHFKEKMYNINNKWSAKINAEIILIFS